MKDLKIALGGKFDGRRLTGTIRVHRRASGYTVTIKCNDREETKVVTEKAYASLRLIDVVGWLEPLLN